jgi:hypothetical protein
MTTNSPPAPRLFFKGGPLDDTSIAKEPVTGRWPTYVTEQGASWRSQYGNAAVAHINTALRHASATELKPEHLAFYVKTAPLRAPSTGSGPGAQIGWRYDHATVVWRAELRKAGWA